MTKAAKLTRLLNADNEVVGYFSDHVAEMAARAEWNDAYRANGDGQDLCCRSIETYITPTAPEDVEPGDGDRESFFWEPSTWRRCVSAWLDCGAASVEVRRYEINRYRRPGRSNRLADLGGPEEAAGALYVLRVRAPRALPEPER